MRWRKASCLRFTPEIYLPVTPRMYFSCEVKGAIVEVRLARNHASRTISGSTYRQMWLIGDAAISRKHHSSLGHLLHSRGKTARLVMEDSAYRSGALYRQCSKRRARRLANFDQQIQKSTHSGIGAATLRPNSRDVVSCHCKLGQNGD